MAAIYQADCYCDDCADEIRKQIQNDGKAPEEPDNESSYDSDEYPKRMSDDEEADTPQHCGCGEECLNAIKLPSGRKVGALLSDNLTTDGVNYVKKYIDADPEGKNEVTQLWAEHFSYYLI